MYLTGSKGNEITLLKKLVRVTLWVLICWTKQWALWYALPLPPVHPPEPLAAPSTTPPAPSPAASCNTRISWKTQIREVDETSSRRNRSRRNRYQSTELLVGHFGVIFPWGYCEFSVRKPYTVHTLASLVPRPHPLTRKMFRWTKSRACTCSCNCSQDLAASLLKNRYGYLSRDKKFYCSKGSAA